MNSLDGGGKDQGIALVTVLWVMVLLMLIVAEFAYSMRTEVNITRNFQDEMKAYYLARAGINLAIAEIIQPARFHYKGKNGLLRFAKRTPFKRKGVKLDGGIISYSIVDEESKLNINGASREILANFFGSVGGEVDIIVDSIMDWRDEDSMYHIDGAEDDYYRGLPASYGSKDASFDSVDELFLVRGISPVLLKKIFGKEGRVSDYLTAKSSSLNYNTASFAVLKATVGEKEAKNIIRIREEKEGIYSSFFRSQYFTVVSSGKLSDSSMEKSVKAIIQKLEGGKWIGVRIESWLDNFIEG